MVFTMRAGTPTATQHGGRLVITTLPAPTCPAAAAAEVTVACLRLLFTHSSCTMQFLPHVYLNIPPKPWSCSQFYSGWRSACRRLRGAVGIQRSTPDEPQLTSRWQRSHSSPHPGADAALLTIVQVSRATFNPFRRPVQYVKESVGARSARQQQHIRQVTIPTSMSSELQ